MGFSVSYFVDIIHETEIEKRGRSRNTNLKRGSRKNGNHSHDQMTSVVTRGTPESGLLTQLLTPGDLLRAWSLPCKIFSFQRQFDPHMGVRSRERTENTNTLRLEDGTLAQMYVKVPGVVESAGHCCKTCRYSRNCCLSSIDQFPRRDSCSEDEDEEDATEQWEEVRRRTHVARLFDL